MSNIFRSSDAHQISRLVRWQFWSDIRNNFTDEFFTFSYTDTTDSDSVPSIVRKKIYRLLSQIQMCSSLYDRKKHSTNIIIFWLQMLEGSLCSTMSGLHMFFDSLFVSSGRRTHIQHHHNI